MRVEWKSEKQDVRNSYQDTVTRWGRWTAKTMRAGTKQGQKNSGKGMSDKCHSSIEPTKFGNAKSQVFRMTDQWVLILISAWKIRKTSVSGKEEVSL